MRLALALVLMLLAVEAAGAAGANLPRPTGIEALRADVRFMEIAAKCSGEVAAKFAYPHPRFDAYVNPTTGGMEGFGTEERTYHFNKCLALRGLNARKIRGGTWTEAHGSIQGRFRFGRDRPVRSIRIHVPNFHEYVGAPRIRFSGPNVPTFGARLTLQHKNWLVMLDQTPDVRGLREALLEHGGYAVVHVGRIQRTSGEAIDY